MTGLHAGPFGTPSNGRGPRGAERNEPCPCGSGRKWKQCCGPKAEAVKGGVLLPPPALKLLFVFPGKMGDCVFALPTMLAAAAEAERRAGRPVDVVWLTRPYTAPILPVLSAGLGRFGDRIEVRTFEGNPKTPPRAAPGATCDDVYGMDWGDWPIDEWLRLSPGCHGGVNASIRTAPRGETHLSLHVFRGAGVPGAPRHVQLDRRRIAQLAPDVPEGRIVWQPTCSEPERCAIDACYAELPPGTVVVRGPDDVGLPESMIRRLGFEEWVGEPVERVAALVAKARLVVGCASLWPLLAAASGVPAVMVHLATTPEQCGITPYGGLDLVNPPAEVLAGVCRRIAG